MKNTTKKILLALYPPEKQLFYRLSQESLKFLVPELTKEGFRSLVYLLEKKELLQSVVLEGTIYFISTDKAQQMIKAQFPALETLNEEVSLDWTVIVFSEPPKGDAQFRYLRTKVIQEGGMALARGVYVLATKLSAQFKQTIESLYRDNVYMFSIGKWYFGAENPIIMKHFHISDTLNSYSSISKEVGELLVIFEAKKRLTNNAKEAFCNIYVRWFEILSEDRGLASRYFPQHVSGVQILRQFQQILQSM